MCVLVIKPRRVIVGQRIEFRVRVTIVVHRTGGIWDIRIGREKPAAAGHVYAPIHIYAPKPGIIDALLAGESMPSDGRHGYLCRATTLSPPQGRIILGGD